MARPTITLKLATSLDGKIALKNGTSEWITCEASRHAGRLLRAGHEAICVGANTAHIDNPQLTTRIAGLSDPVRVIFDSKAALSPSSNLAQTAMDVPVLLFCAQEADIERRELLSAMGVQLLPIEHNEAGLDIAQAMTVLKRAQGIESLLLEGGGKLAASFVRAGMVDRIEWFRAPIIIGADGRDCIGALNLSLMDEAYGFRRISVQELDVDLRETYERGML